MTRPYGAPPPVAYFDGENDADRLDQATEHGTPAQWNADGTGLVGPDGAQMVFPTSCSMLYDPGEARLVRNTGGALTIPTYVPTDDAVVHPSVVRVPGGWKGYEYWMAITPYTGSDSQYENPSIFCSVDGKTWAVPTGVTNPLIAYPGGVNYNSDPYLFFMPAGKMCIYWRQINGANMIHKYITSTDGVNWSVEQTSLTTVRASEDLLSPSIIWEPDAQQYRMYAHDAELDGYNIVTATASSLEGPWSSRTQCSYGLPAGYSSVWHSEFRPVGGGRCIGLIQSGTNSGGKIYAADAVGSTIRLGRVVMTRNGTPNVYKCSLSPRTDNTAECWFGFLSAPSMGVEYGQIAYNNTFFAKNNAAVLAAMTTGTLPTLGGGITWDSFNRADGGIGTPTAGVTWTVHSGGLNVASNAVTGASAANNKAYIDSGASDIFIRVQCPVFAGAGAWIMFRISNPDSDFWRVQLDSGLVTLQKIVSGAVSVAYSKVYSVFAGDELSVIAQGNSIQILVNNIIVIEVNDATYNTATKHGLQISNTSDKFDNFLLMQI